MNLDEKEEAFEKALASEVYALNMKLKDIKRQKIEDPTFDQERDSVLKTFYNQKDRLILKCSYNKNHQTQMTKQFPAIPVHVLSDSEKACFQFAKSLDFESGFYSINGKVSLQKSHFIDNSTNKFNQFGMPSGESAAQKTQFIGPECQVMPQMKNNAHGAPDPNGHLKDMLKNTFFGEFLDAAKSQQDDQGPDTLKDFVNPDEHLISGDADQKEEEQIIVSQSVHSEDKQGHENLLKPIQGAQSDPEMLGQSSSSSDDALSFDGARPTKTHQPVFRNESSSIPVAQAKAAEKVQNAVEPAKATIASPKAEEKVKTQETKVPKSELPPELQKFSCTPMLPQDAYDVVENDTKIRDAMVNQKFEMLNKINKEHRVRAKRMKYWGELKDSVSQSQIDKDYHQYRYYEKLLPNEVITKEPFFFVEPVSAAGAPGKANDRGGGGAGLVVPFTTKYGSLNLCGAHPNNFKIDDIREYEFVQR